MSTTTHNNEPQHTAGPSIAIIGTEGSGKTVLTTVLAKHLSRIDSRGIFLNPQGVATLRYVERVWQTLQDGDWPPSTNPGELFELRWKLEMVGELESPVRLIDAAGQDLRVLFGEEKVNDRNLPESLRNLADYCRSADIILFLINLKDFEGQADPRRRTDNEAAIKSAMDYLSSDGRRRFCIVFTQADLYEGIVQQRGGWLAVAREVIPYISGAYLQSVRNPKYRRVLLFPVSAVNKTRIAVDEHGVPRRVPDPPFGSAGLDAVVEWMTTQVREIHQLRKPPSLPPTPPPPLEVPPWFKYLKENWHYFAAGVLCLMTLRSCAGGCGPSTPTRPTIPDPVVSEARWQKNPGIFDDSVTSYGTVRNKGAAGNVVVTSRVIENGKEVDRRSQSMFLNADQQASFRIELPGIYDVRNPHEVQTSASVPRNDQASP
jgi:hypothetical protein